MNISVIIIAISCIWILSEVALAKIKHSKTKHSVNQYDLSSLRSLWITIMGSISVGVFLGIQSIGYIRVGTHFISILGLLLIVFGLAIRWIAILTLRRLFTVDVSILRNHQIIRHGIYKFVRHPAYAGSLLSFLGLGLSFANWVSTLVIFVPILVAFMRRIRLEERVLINAFGDEYINYCKTAKRLIPGIY